MSERHFRRLRDRYGAEGAEGLIDRRRGRMSGRRVPVDRIEWVLEQYRTHYFDFTVKHFHERLQTERGFELSYTWVKDRLQAAGLVRPAPKRSAHRKKRPRRPCRARCCSRTARGTPAWRGSRPWI
jgi:transposase